MANWVVEKDGNVNKSAKVGDNVYTGGGVYQIVDGSKYEGLIGTDKASAMAADGVGYNAASGRYSRKVNGATTNNYSSVQANKVAADQQQYGREVNLLGSSGLDDWKNSYINNSQAKINNEYNSLISQLKQSYNSTVGDYANQINDVNYDYDDSVRQSTRDAYYNQRAVVEGANRMGLTNSAQGAAMSNSALWNSALERGDLDTERKKAISNLKQAITTTTDNYNTRLSEADQQRISAELDAMSDAELQYLQTMLGIDEYNASQINTAASEKAGYEHDTAMTRLNASLSGGGSGSTSSTSTTNREDEYALAQYYIDFASDDLDEDQFNRLNQIAAGIPVGAYSYADFERLYKQYKQANSRSSANEASAARTSNPVQIDENLQKVLNTQKARR